MPSLTMNVTFTFTKLVVENLDASQKFYEGVFDLSDGIEVVDEIGGRPIREIIYQRPDGRSALILLTFTDDIPQGRGDVILGVATNDADATTRRVTDYGGAVIDPPRDMDTMGVKIRVAIVADNEGHIIEIVENK